MKYGEKQYGEFAERRQVIEDAQFTLSDYLDFGDSFCKRNRYSFSAHFDASGNGKATFTPIVGNNVMALEDPADGIFSIDEGDPGYCRIPR